MSAFPSIDDGDFELYALGALGTEESRRVRQALEDAEPEQREAMLRRIAEAREAAAALVEAEDLDEAPPARVRAQLLEAIDRGHTADRSTSDGDAIDARSRFRPATLAAAAAVVLLLGAGVVAIAVRSGDNTAEIAGPESSTAQTSEPGVDDGPTGMVDQIMAAPDANIVNASLDSGATVKVMESEQLDMAVLEISGMPEPSEGMHYQLWLNGFGPNPIAGGAMSIGADGSTLMGGIEELARTSGVAVTQEPNSDLRPPAPTGEVLMEMEMA